MTPIVVLALTVMVMAVGVTLVAGFQLWRAVSRLGSTARATADRIRPLADELAEGTTVSTAEAEALAASVGRLTASRQRRPRRSR